jgi:hypothetical protein
VLNSLIIAVVVVDSSSLSQTANSNRETVLRQLLIIEERERGGNPNCFIPHLIFSSTSPPGLPDTLIYLFDLALTCPLQLCSAKGAV